MAKTAIVSGPPGTTKMRLILSLRRIPVRLGTGILPEASLRDRG
jgi:hypothetical protein